MFQDPTPRPVRACIGHAVRRVALAVAVRLLDRLVPTGLTITLVPAAAELAAPAPAAASTSLFTVEELPPLEAIEAAAVVFDRAADAARVADRAKRKARRLLDRLPAGSYGRATVERVQNAKQTPDLDQIRADYARAGLGEVPMRDVAPTLRVTVAPAAASDVTVLVGVAA